MADHERTDKLHTALMRQHTNGTHWREMYHAMKHHAEEMEQQMEDWKQMGHEAIE